MATVKKIYKNSKWEKVRQFVITRDKGICFFCGKLVLKKWTIHHIKEINEENVNDENITYNPNNLVLSHSDCHDMHHRRFGYKKVIVNDDLNIDYGRRLE